MGNGLDLALVSFSLPGMRAELGLSPAEVGYILPMAGIGQLTGAIAVGWLADKIGRRLAFMLSGCLAGLGIGLGALAPGPLVLRCAALDRGHRNRRGCAGRQRAPQRACAADPPRQDDGVDSGLLGGGLVGCRDAGRLVRGIAGLARDSGDRRPARRPGAGELVRGAGVAALPGRTRPLPACPPAR